MPSNRSPGQRGFALMMAVFMIVTLAAIAVYLLTVSTGQIQATTQDEQGARAYRAARTGIDWGAYQILRNSGGTFATACAGGSASNTLTFTAPQLNGFRSQIACSLVGSETEGSVTVKIYLLTATGCNASPASCGSSLGPTYVERQLQLTLTREL
jgi:MSHA biogenesis protein MshP